MINISEVRETNDMIEKENLDVRTITMDIESINIAIFQICLVDIVISKDTPVGMAT